MNNTLSIQNHIIQTHQVDDSRTDVNYNLSDRLGSLFSFIWGGAAGILLGQALNNEYSWPIRLCVCALPISWFIFSSKSIEYCAQGDNTPKEKVTFVSLQKKIVILAVSLIFFVCIFLNFNTPFPSIPIVITLYLVIMASNLLLSYVRQNRDLLSSISSRIRTWWVNNFTQTPESNDMEELKAKLHRDIIVYKKKNMKSSKALERLWLFINQDRELLAKFYECYNRSIDRLLPLPKLPDSVSTGIPLLDERSNEVRIDHYYNSMKTRVYDFLNKNPDFYELLRLKIGNIK